MAAETKSYEGLMHAGAGTGLVLLQLSALIPGLLPSLALAGLIAAVVVGRRRYSLRPASVSVDPRLAANTRVPPH